MPAFALAMGRVFNELNILSPRPAIAMIAMMIVTTWWQHSTVGTNLVAKENFNPSEILAQWHSDSERVPPVRFVGLATDDSGKGGDGPSTRPNTTGCSPRASPTRPVMSRCSDTG